MKMKAAAPPTTSTPISAAGISKSLVGDDAEASTATAGDADGSGLSAAAIDADADGEADGAIVAAADAGARPDGTRLASKVPLGKRVETS